MAKRKIELMHDLFGKCPGEVCADCEHFLSYKHHDRRMHKCFIYGDTRSEASDWRVHYPACGLFPNEMPPGGCSVIRMVRPERKKDDDEIPGQMTMEDYLDGSGSGESIGSGAKLYQFCSQQNKESQ